MAPSTAVYDRLMKNAIRYPDGQVEFRCPVHGPMIGDAIQTPRHSCEDCWGMYAFKLLACTPPEEREFLKQESIRVLTEAARLTERGDWDVEWTAPQMDEIDPADITLTDRQE